MENIENSNVLIAEIKSILAYKAKEGASYRDVKGKLWVRLKRIAYRVFSPFN